MAAVRENAGVGVVFFFVVLQTALRGAFTVFVVVVAIDLLDGGESGVGVLQGAVGIGALCGSLVCNLLVGSRAMTRWLGIAVVLWGVPMAVMGLVPEYAVALSAAAVVGVGNSLVDVTAFTLIARMVPDAVLARVFGVLESVGALGVALGSLVAPMLVETIGARAALVVVGAVAPVACALFWRRAARVDRSVAVRTDAIVLLRQVPMLRPLPVTAIEAAGPERRPVTTSGRAWTCSGPGTSGDASTSSRTDGSRCSTTSRWCAPWAPARASARSPCSGHHAHDDGPRRRDDPPLRDLCGRLPARRHRHQRGPRRRGGRPCSSTCGTRRGRAADDVGPTA